jgi:hypothetical protein
MVLKKHPVGTAMKNTVVSQLQVQAAAIWTKAPWSLLLLKKPHLRWTLVHLKYLGPL